MQLIFVILTKKEIFCKQIGIFLCISAIGVANDNCLKTLKGI